MDDNVAPTSPPGPTTSRLLAARHRIQRIINTSGKDESTESSSSDENADRMMPAIERTKASRSTDKRAKEQVEAWISIDDEENKANKLLIKKTQFNEDISISNNIKRVQKDKKQSGGVQDPDGVRQRKEMDYADAISSDEEISLKVSEVLWIREVIETQRNTLEAFKATNCILVGGIQKVLKHHGVEIKKKDAMDGSSPVSASRLVMALAKSLGHVK